MVWRKYDFLMWVLLICPCLLMASPHSNTHEQRTALNLIQLKGRITEQLKTVNLDIKNSILELQSRIVSLKKTTPHQNQKISNDLKAWQAIRLELSSRQKFIDNLLYNYSQHVGPLTIKEKLLLTLSRISLQESQSDNPDMKYVIFVSHLTRAMRDLCEPNEDPFLFIETYIHFSTIQDPKDPSEFARKAHHYVGQKKSLSLSISPADGVTTLEASVK